MNYLHWLEKIISPSSSPEEISALYEQGFVFTRIGKGVMQQTRSVRINLSAFTLSSENKRVLKKVEGVELNSQTIPLQSYDFTLGKLAKDFYEAKFGPGIMSAQKIKEMLTDKEKSNFNVLLHYTDQSLEKRGYVITYMNNDILHYSYPFYDLTTAPKDMGLGMMTKAIEHAKRRGMKYIYLGSLQRPTDTYKLQFAGLEWFDGEKWSDDIEKVKEILSPIC